VSVAPATPTKKRPRTGDRSGTGDACRVIVLNDDHNTFDGVAFALATVLPGVGFDEGQAIVWSGHREPAELYWTRLKELGLTMAPLEG
jgi:ATP-dependent Clp protease adaptor protein ClpS